MIGQRLETIFNKAIREANKRRHEFLVLESILLALLDDQVVIKVLKDCDVPIEDLRHEIEEFLNKDENFSIITEEQVEELGQKQFADEKLRKMAQGQGIFYQPEISLSLQRVIQRAALHVESSGKNDIEGIHLLVALFSEKESHAVYFLEKHGCYRHRVVENIAHSIDRPLTELEEQGSAKKSSASNEDENIKKALENYAVNLNEMAKMGKIDPIIGRENELARIIQILGRRQKNNPLLVGDSGVGKTAIAEGLALKITQENVPEFLKNTTVYGLDLSSLLAGTKYRGDFEKRLKLIIKGIKKKDHQEHHDSILFIDELHTIIGAGATSGGTLDASNILKPLLANGEIRCMGSTTFEEFKKYFEKDRALSRRFQKIDVNEPNIGNAIKILEGVKEKYENHHGVKYSTGVIKKAVELSAKYLPEKKLPDKAIDCIDEAGSMAKLKSNVNGKKRKISVKDIETVVSFMANIPKKSVTTTEKEKLKYLARDLKLMIFGQDEAIKKVVSAIMLAKSGLGIETRPIANFLFAGPTGVGKTELAKQLAQNLSIHFERFDMSEYAEKHTASKLIGAPPGYVGHEEGGLLTDAIFKNPHCVLLLDEIEKGHFDIYNLLLQVMDHGVLTDSNGRVVSFKNVILIMTTNTGAREIEQGRIGIGSKETGASYKRDHSIKGQFSPEFRNRLDSIIHFEKLGIKEIEKIVNKFLVELEFKLKEKKVDIQIDNEVITWIGKKSYDPKLGARPIARYIDDNIKRYLADEILFGKLDKGGVVKISLQNDKIEFHVSEKK